MKNVKHVLFLFLDGVGIGKKNASINPFFASNLKTIPALFGGKLFHLKDARHTSTKASLIPINATLGVPGLPQSGTGQTALLTGVNASKFIGKHFGPYPYSTLKPVIKEKNIFGLLATAGKSVLYANAFPPKFFEYINSPKTRTTAIAMSWMSSGFSLNTHETLAAGKALSSDLTSERWNTLGFPPVPELTLYNAGKQLASISAQHNFVLYEYYITDHAGHNQSMKESVEVLERYDGFLEGLLSNIDLNETVIILTSDHGNIEDLSTKSHTRNPVPLLVIGKGHKEVVSKIRNLTHVAPVILNLLQ